MSAAAGDGELSLPWCLHFFIPPNSFLCSPLLHTAALYKHLGEVLTGLQQCDTGPELVFEVSTAALCTVFTVTVSLSRPLHLIIINSVFWMQLNEPVKPPTSVSLGDDQPGAGVYWSTSCLQQCSSFCWGRRKGGRRGLELHPQLPLPAPGYTQFVLPLSWALHFNLHKKRWSFVHNKDQVEMKN